MRLLVLSGSLRAGASSTALLQAAALRDASPRAVHVGAQLAEALSAMAA